MKIITLQLISTGIDSDHNVMTVTCMQKTKKTASAVVKGIKMVTHQGLEPWTP